MLLPKNMMFTLIIIFMLDKITRQDFVLFSLRTIVWEEKMKGYNGGKLDGLWHQTGPFSYRTHN